MTMRKFPNLDVTMVYNTTYNLNLALHFDKLVVRPRNCQIDTHNTNILHFGRGGGRLGSIDQNLSSTGPKIKVPTEGLIEDTWRIDCI